MDIRETIDVRDYHVAGRPVRLITGGVPLPSWTSPTEQVAQFRQCGDRWRQWAMAEPRGHLAMTGALVLPAQDPEAVVRLLYMDALGYPTGDGAADVSAVTDLLSTGRLGQPWERPPASLSTYRVESPAGLQAVHVARTRDRIESVSYQAPLPPILDTIVGKTLGTDAPASCIAQGEDSRYMVVPVEGLGLEVALEQAPHLQHAAQKMRAAVGEDTGILFVSASAEGGPARQTLVWADGRIDRSPLGGIAAHLAWLRHTGQRATSEPFRVLGLAGGEITVHVVEEEAPAYAMVHTTPFLVAMRRLFVDPADPIQPFTIR